MRNGKKKREMGIGGRINQNRDIVRAPSISEERVNR
jgi:hypothetical protein